MSSLHRENLAKIISYRDLIVWQKSMRLVCEMYEMTSKFPREEMYGLTSQMRCAAVSIPSNIAEGKRRGSKKEFSQFLRFAFGSGAELETQIAIAKSLHSMRHIDTQHAEVLLDEVMRMLQTLIGRLRA